MGTTRYAQKWGEEESEYDALKKYFEDATSTKRATVDMSNKRAELIANLNRLIPTEMLNLHIPKDVAFNKRLVLVCGVPGSGKGYWCKKQVAVHVSGDSLVYSKKCATELRKLWGKRKEEAFRKVWDVCNSLQRPLTDIILNICATHGVDVVLESSMPLTVAAYSKIMTGYLVRQVLVYASPETCWKRIGEREAKMEDVIAHKANNLKEFRGNFRRHCGAFCNTLLNGQTMEIITSDGKEAKDAFVKVVAKELLSKGS